MSGAIVPPLLVRESSQLAIPSGSTVSFAHGFGKKPHGWQAVLVCVTAELGYSIGDEFDVTTTPSDTGTSSAGGSWANSSSVGFTAQATTFIVTNRTTFANNGITAANWKIVLRAWL